MADHTYITYHDGKEVERNGALAAIEAENIFFRFNHLSVDECLDQIDAHLETEGYDGDDIEYAIEFIENRIAA